MKDWSNGSSADTGVWCAARARLRWKTKAYNFPQGVICQLVRDIAAGRPGCITHVGLDTFIDPIHDGGRINSRSTEALVERIELGGKTWLWYKAFPIHVALIRGSAADPLGNLIMTEEAIIGEALPLAQAAHNCGGIVIAQVKRLLDQPANPHMVRVPGVLIEAGLAGLPSIAYDVGGVTEVVKQDDTGIAVKVGDYAGFVDALEGLCDRPDRRAQIGEQARALCRSRFDINTVTSQYAELFKQLVSGAPLSLTTRVESAES